MSAPSLDLSHPNDTPKNTQLVQALHDLVNGESNPESAARRINEIIVTDCTGPNKSHPAGWQEYLWKCIGRAAMALSPQDPAQDRLVQLLQELQKLPRHCVPFEADGKVLHIELWTLTLRNHYDGFEQWMWELDQGQHVGAHQVERSETAAVSYENFSAFLARLLASGVVEATRLSALFRPSPFATSNPTESTYNKQHHEPYVRAAGQWILCAGNALFEMCEKETITEIGGRKFTPKVWINWRAKIEAAEKAEYFSSECREFARQVLARMLQIEQEGITTDIVNAFGFMVVKETEDE